jgi:hypothetical protein
LWGDNAIYCYWEVLVVSIVRIGLAETKHFSEGYAAIFAKKKKGDQVKPAKQKAKAKKASKKTAKAGKKKAKR